MDLLSDYGDAASPSRAESPDEEEAGDADFSFRETQLVTAPAVDSTGLVLSENGAVPAAKLQHLQAVDARRVYANLPYEQMHAPLVGPANPSGKSAVAPGARNHRAGHVEDHFMANYHFDDQYNTFHGFGTAAAPSGQGVVTGADPTVPEAKRRRTEEQKAAAAARKAAAAQGAVQGAEWALGQRQPWAERAIEPARPTEEQLAWLKAEGFIKDEEEEAAADGKGRVAEKTIFHGEAEVDSLGRSWIEPPRERKPPPAQAYLPKKLLHTWAGHAKGVNAIRFFPGTGHLLLSAGLDGKIKIWDVGRNRKCLRTYIGFTKGVRDIQFSNDGRRFLSTGYDKVIKLWDTETGQALQSFGEGKMFFVSKFHPSPDKQNVLMAGCQDKKVYQWDMDSGDLVQEYDYHLAAVNTITFVDDGRRFVSTSDDKTIRVWEFGIPVQIKYIADPAMHSIPAVTLHPNGSYFIGQSMDNQIVTYSAKDKFRQNRKKVFKGHTVAGYACQPCFSPDGKYVVSGDGEGKAWFWDWKSCKAYRTIKAHEGVCIDAAWHPLETSNLATAGWDGKIKYWD